MTEEPNRDRIIRFVDDDIILQGVKLAAFLDKDRNVLFIYKPQFNALDTFTQGCIINTEASLTSRLVEVSF